MTLREKLMHYTHDLDCDVDLKQEAIATIEHIAQYMDEDELLHHSRPLAIAYLALTEDDSVPVVHRKDCKHHENEEIGMVYCPNQIGGWVKENWFCADGERKDDENA